MGYIDGNLVKSTGENPVFKVNVSSDNSPHCWNNLPTACTKTFKYNGKPVSWLSLGAVKHNDITLKNQVTTGGYWHVGTDVTSYKSVANSALNTGLTYLSDRIGLKFGLSIGGDGKPKLHIMLAKAIPPEEEEEEEEEGNEEEVD